RVGIGGAGGEARVAAGELVSAEADRGRPAAPGGVPVRVESLLGQLARDPHARADDLRVEAPGEPAIAGDEQQADVRLVLVLDEQRHLSGVCARRPRGLLGHPPQTLGVRPQRLYPLLGAAQAGRRAHLPPARDLLDVLTRVDLVANVALAGHELLLAALGRARTLELFAILERLPLLVEVVAEVLRVGLYRLAQLLLELLRPLPAGDPGAQLVVRGVPPCGGAAQEAGPALAPQPAQEAVGGGKDLPGLAPAGQRRALALVERRDEPFAARERALRVHIEVRAE